MVLKNTFQSIARWEIVLISTILTVSFMIILSGPPQMLKLQFAFSEKAFSRIISEWGKNDLHEAQRKLWIDLLFPFAYAFCLSSWLAWFSVRPGGEESRYLTILLTLPFVAGLFDWIENTSHLLVFRDIENPSGVLILLGAAAVSIKWAILLTFPVLGVIYYCFIR